MFSIFIRFLSIYLIVICNLFKFPWLDMEKKKKSVETYDYHFLKSTKDHVDECFLILSEELMVLTITFISLIFVSVCFGWHKYIYS